MLALRVFASPDLFALRPKLSEDHSDLSRNGLIVGSWQALSSHRYRRDLASGEGLAVFGSASRILRRSS